MSGADVNGVADARQATRRYHAHGRREALHAALGAWDRVLARLGRAELSCEDLTEVVQLRLTQFELEFEQSHDIRDTIALAQEAVERCRDRPSRVWALVLSALAQSAGSEFSGDPVELEAAISTLTDVLASPALAPNVTRIARLAGARMAARDAELRELADLEDVAIEMLTEALEGGLPRFQRILALRSLARALMRRYLRGGTVADLQRALDCDYSVARLISDGTRPYMEAALSAAQGFLLRHHVRRDPADLERATEPLDRLGGAPEDLRADAELVRALLLIQRAASFATPSELDRAIAIAADLSGPVDAYSAALVWRHATTGNVHALTLAAERRRELGTSAEMTAVETLHAVVPGLPSEVERASASVGQLLRILVGDDGDAIADAFRAAHSQTVRSNLPLALDLALSWIGWAESTQRWPDATEAGRCANAALDRLHAGQVGRGAQEAWLRRTASIATTLTWSLLTEGLVSDAVVELERSRTRILGEVLGREAVDLDELRAAVGDELADSFERLSLEVSQRDNAAPGSDLASDMPPQVRTLVGSARKELADVVEAIRAHATGARFLEAETFEAIADVSAGAPLVYLVATRRGGIALIVADGRTEAVRLPQLRDAPDALRRHLDEYSQTPVGDPIAWSMALNRLTRWLWDACMGPVLAALRDRTGAVLIPTGALGDLPLHVAWTPDPATLSGRRYALDELQLVYAPSARTLRAARHREDAANVEHLFAAIDPQPVDAPPLPSAASERISAGKWFEHATVLSGPQALVPALGEALRGASVAHFACHADTGAHGFLDPALRFAHNDRLTFRSIVGSRLSAPTVVLSACETGMTDRRVPDEALGLPTAFLQAGAARVISTLWPIPDEGSAVVMHRFYELWRGQGRPPAAALRDAQRWARDATRAEQRAALPWLEALDDVRVPPAARPFWNASRPHANPVHWGAFAYVGA